MIIDTMQDIHQYRLMLPDINKGPT